MRFTIIAAAYNRAHTLSAAYQSLCPQTLRNFEWVIVDDGSIDRTRELVASWKSLIAAPDGLGRQGDLRFSSPKGAVLYHAELAFSNVPARTRLNSAINAVRFSLVALAREMRLLK